MEGALWILQKIKEDFTRFARDNFYDDSTLRCMTGMGAETQEGVIKLIEKISKYIDMVTV